MEVGPATPAATVSLLSWSTQHLSSQSVMPYMAHGAHLVRVRVRAWVRVRARARVRVNVRVRVRIRG